MPKPTHTDDEGVQVPLPAGYTFEPGDMIIVGDEVRICNGTVVAGGHIAHSRRCPIPRRAVMIEREYGAICECGHRSYLRLQTEEPLRLVRCPACGDNARAWVLAGHPRTDPTRRVGETWHDPCLDPTAAQALRAEQVRRIADVDRQWCANIEAAGVELESAVAATISQMRTERDELRHTVARLKHLLDAGAAIATQRDALLSVAEAAKEWREAMADADDGGIGSSVAEAHDQLLAAVDEWQKAVTDG
jgi:hypothetical protein